MACRLRPRAVLGAVAVALAAIGLWQVALGAAIHAKAWLAQRLLQRAWQRTLAGESEVKPWPWADTWPVARLRVPAHGADLIVLDGVSGRTLAFGPGHAHGTAQPGAPGTAIISGHRDTHFRFLANARVGDEILVETVAHGGARYRVSTIGVVDGGRGRIVSDADDSTLALVTCYPFDAVVPGGPLRWIVAAERVTAPPSLVSAR